MWPKKKKKFAYDVDECCGEQLADDLEEGLADAEADRGATIGDPEDPWETRWKEDVAEKARRRAEELGSASTKYPPGFDTGGIAVSGLMPPVRDLAYWKRQAESTQARLDEVLDRYRELLESPMIADSAKEMLRTWFRDIIDE